MSGEQPKQSGSSKRKTGGQKRGGNSKQADNNEPVSLVRNSALGMAPRAILTGYYGSRGERLRHTVHDGALQMPKDALDLIEKATTETKISAPKSYDLPGLDCVVRPCLDPELEELVVTEVSFQKIVVPQENPAPETTESTNEAEEQPQATPVFVDGSKVENWTYRRPALKTAPTERIRGGGADEDNKMNIDTSSGTTAQLPSVTNQQGEASIGNTAAPGQPQLQSQPSSAVAPGSLPNAPPATSAIAPQPGQVMHGSAAATSSQQFTPATLPAQATPMGQPGAKAPPPATTSIGNFAAQKPQTPTETKMPLPLNAPQAPAAVTTVPAKPAPAPTPAANTAATAKTIPQPVRSHSAIMPAAQVLPSKPAPHWDQHKPGPNDEMVTPADQLTPRPSWYKKDSVADIERTMLPEWFNGTASHRTPKSYIEAREKIISVSDTIANRNVTNSMVRRYVVGDSGSLHRLRQFLVNFGLINEDGINDSAPTPAILRDNKPTAPITFDEKLRENLLDAVVEQSKKRKFGEMTTSNDSDFVPIDWEEVAVQVGHGATSADCEKNFLSLDLERLGLSSETERSITPDLSSDLAKTMPHNVGGATDVVTHDHVRKEIFRNLIETTDSQVMKKILKASFAASGGDLRRAQKASLLGLSATKAVEEAREQEVELSSVLSQLVNERMKKLENRMALLDDVEGIMEAEKVALELERRDLYTARCRHWFGGA